MKTQNPKFLFLLICFLAFSFNAVANDTIRFNITFANDDVLEITIKASNEKQFTVDWGDGSEIETETGTGQYQEIRHYYINKNDYIVNIIGTTSDCFFTSFSIRGSPYYWLTHLDVNKSPSLNYLACDKNKLSTLDLSHNTALAFLYIAEDKNLGSLNLTYNTALTGLQCFDNPLHTLDLGNSLIEVECNNNLLSSLNMSNNTALELLKCQNNKLTNLSVNNNIQLKNFKCQNNKLPLSNLYEISKTIKPIFESEIEFGEQRLNSQTIEVGEEIDFSAEKEFGGFATVFTVEKNGLPAPENDYTISGGFITFHTEGKYQVSMANSAITGGGWNFVPANVIAEINVGNVGIGTITKDELRIKVYPNPTTGELRIANYELRIDNIEIFDIYGRKVGAKFPSNVLEGWQPQADGVVLNISHLNSGIYFMKITTEQGVITKKIIKN